MKYFVLFNDEAQGANVEWFETFEEAVEYWDAYADTPTCTGGLLFDVEESDVVWKF